MPDSWELPPVNTASTSNTTAPARLMRARVGGGLEGMDIGIGAMSTGSGRGRRVVGAPAGCGGGGVGGVAPTYGVVLVPVGRPYGADGRRNLRARGRRGRSPDLRGGPGSRRSALRGRRAVQPPGPGASGACPDVRGLGGVVPTYGQVVSD